MRIAAALLASVCCLLMLPGCANQSQPADRSDLGNPTAVSRATGAASGQTVNRATDHLF